MTIIEGVALMQRILNSAKADADALNTVESAGIKGKLEILEGEMNLFRQFCDEAFGEPTFVADQAPEVVETEVPTEISGAEVAAAAMADPGQLFNLVQELEKKAANGEISRDK